MMFTGSMILALLALLAVFSVGIPSVYFHSASTTTKTIANTLVNITNFPSPNDPLLCIAFVSCGRLAYLRKTVASAFEHIEAFEPTLKYETLWVDQNPSDYSAEIAASFPFTARVVASQAMGFAWPRNVILEMCNAPFLLVLEEDFPLIAGIEKTISSGRADFLAEAIDLISRNSAVSGVLLRGETDYTGPGVRYKECVDAETGMRWCLRETTEPVPPFSSYTNGPAVYSVERLKSVGRMPEKDQERAFAAMVRSHGLSLASLQRKKECSNPCDSSCNRVAEHIARKGESTWLDSSNNCTGKISFGF